MRFWRPVFLPLNYQGTWRREWDSNPRNYSPCGFQDRRLKPDSAISPYWRFVRELNPSLPADNRVYFRYTNEPYIGSPCRTRTCTCGIKVRYPAFRRKGYSWQPLQDLNSHLRNQSPASFQLDERASW